MSNKIYVGNLSWNVDENTLSEQFQSFGTVSSCKIITDRDTGRSKGFAFVEMSSPAEAEEAIRELEGFMLDGRNLRVSEAKPQAPRNNQGSRGGNRW